MRMEKAVINMVEAARQKDVAPERLARLFEVALEKVASVNPVGTQALKIVQTNFLKDILRSELNVVVRMQRGPRKPRTPRDHEAKRTLALEEPRNKVPAKARGPTDEVADAILAGAIEPPVAPKPRGRRKKAATK